MGTEGTLSPRKTRRAEAAVGEPLTFARVLRHPAVDCVTPDHRHFLWDRRTGAVKQYEPSVHWTDCPWQAADHYRLPVAKPGQPAITWEHVDMEVAGRKVAMVRATHPGEPCVFVNGQCTCGVMDLGVTR